jgi:hypothetical protein
MDTGNGCDDPSSHPHKNPEVSPHSACKITVTFVIQARITPFSKHRNKIFPESIRVKMQIITTKGKKTAFIADSQFKIN